MKILSFSEVKRYIAEGNYIIIMHGFRRYYCTLHSYSEYLGIVRKDTFRKLHSEKIIKLSISNYYYDRYDKSPED